LDFLEEQPWRFPGADITDYFNYGFTEESYRIYAARQQAFRMEHSMQGKIQVFDSSNGTPQPAQPQDPYVTFLSSLLYVSDRYCYRLFV